MLTNQNIICISSIDWDFIWQGHQEIMATFAKNGNRVLFIENTGVRSPGVSDIPRLRKRVKNWISSVKGFREERENLFVYSPLVLPFPYSKIARWINRYLLIHPLRKWIKAMEFHDSIVWTFLPTGTAIDIAESIERKLLVYYCIADFYKLTSPAKVKKTEDELIRKCDLIFAQGVTLKEKCEKLNNNVHIFPFGVNFEAFKRAGFESGEPPSDMRAVKKPVIGYIGGIHRHIDFGLIRSMAIENPEWSFVLVGPLQTEASEISNVSNVHMLGKKEFTLLPSYVREFDVCIIPYQLNEYTQTVFPTKLNEYHAAGKPVVSTALPEIASYNRENNNLVSVGDTKERFTSEVKGALRAQDSEITNKRVSAAKKHSWNARISGMSDLMEATIKEKEEDRTGHWKTNFLKLYKKSRKGLFILSTLALVLYAALFYTPLVWHLAEPHKISDKLEKADAIVVFAGGVGESGKVGQGYEERVNYAVNLYKDGYAKHMIFSSGYMYIFKEPLVMKALAVASGVPEEAIYLEDKAKNTRENILFTDKILKNRGWRKILLVTSPYHTRRVAEVFKKIPGIEVIYAPIPDSHFYRHSARGADGELFWRRINSDQISGIIHEYLAILYYRWKGYI